MRRLLGCGRYVAFGENDRGRERPGGRSPLTPFRDQNVAVAWAQNVKRLRLQFGRAGHVFALKVRVVAVEFDVCVPGGIASAQGVAHPRRVEVIRKDGLLRIPDHARNGLLLKHPGGDDAILLEPM